MGHYHTSAIQVGELALYTNIEPIHQPVLQQQNKQTKQNNKQQANNKQQQQVTS